MTKILAKIARRHDGEELPDRRELVEMDLFDTDRNPWSPIGGGDELWTRHDYDLAVPFYVPENADTFGTQVIGPIDLVVERTSLAVAFVGGVFDMVSGAGEFIHLEFQVQNTMIANSVVAACTRNVVANANGYRMPVDGWAWGVLNPATYHVLLYVSITTVDDPHPVARFTEFAATVALLPAGLADASISGGGLV